MTEVRGKRVKTACWQGYQWVALSTAIQVSHSIAPPADSTPWYPINGGFVLHNPDEPGWYPHTAVRLAAMAVKGLNYREVTTSISAIDNADVSILSPWSSTSPSFWPYLSLSLKSLSLNLTPSIPHPSVLPQDSKRVSRFRKGTAGELTGYDWDRMVGGQKFKLLCCGCCRCLSSPGHG